MKEKETKKVKDMEKGRPIFPMETSTMANMIRASAMAR